MKNYRHAGDVVMKSHTSKSNVDQLHSTFFNPRPHLLFCHPRPHLGGVGWVGVAAPQPICPLNSIDLRSKDERKVLDVLNPTILDLTTLIPILTFPGQVKQKMFSF